MGVPPYVLARKCPRFTAAAEDNPANPSAAPVRLRSVRLLSHFLGLTGIATTLLRASVRYAGWATARRSQAEFLRQALSQLALAGFDQATAEQGPIRPESHDHS